MEQLVNIDVQVSIYLAEIEKQSGAVAGLLREIYFALPENERIEAAKKHFPEIVNKIEDLTPELTTMQEAYDIEGSIYLIILDEREGFVVGSKGLGHFIAEIQDSDHWAGGDTGSFTNDSNINFDSIQQAENYYKRTYSEVMVFLDEEDRDEMVSIMENNGLWK